MRHEFVRILHVRIVSDVDATAAVAVSDVNVVVVVVRSTQCFLGGNSTDNSQ
jgi:hypothetical protein